MKKSVMLTFLLVFHLSVNADTPPGKQISHAKFQIVKNTIEFLASDRETFGAIKETTCDGCKSYNELIAYISRNKIKKADDLVRKWKAVQVDTTSANWEESLVKFKDRVISDVSTGPKSQRQQLAGFPSYKNGLDSVIGEVAIDENAVDEPVTTKPDSVKSSTKPAETAVEEPEGVGYFSSLPTLSKDMNYTVIFFLLAVIILLLWILISKSNALKKKVSSLQDQLVKSENAAWQSQGVSMELKSTSQKLKNADKEIAALQEELKAERERIQRLAVVEEIEDLVVEIPASTWAPVIKYARYADQGDGFSVQELLDEEDSETIFELTILSASSASFKISGNQNAQRYALSNSSYFLGKASKYDAFPSGNSLINTDVPGELKLQNGKWLIVKPVQISFS